MGNPSVFVVGHRGMGGTDHDLYRSPRIRFAENTISGIKAAYRLGAAAVEVDVVMSRDGAVFALHSVDPADHFFDPENTEILQVQDKERRRRHSKRHIPPDFLHKLSFDQIRTYRSGRCQNGEIATLSQVLQTVHQYSPRTGPYCINIEVKGVMGTKHPFETNDFLQNIADVICRHKVSLSRILLSSFCLQNIIKLSCLLPEARYGMLFSDKTHAYPIYANHQDNLKYTYLPGSKRHFARVQDIWQSEANKAARLSCYNLEIKGVSDSIIENIARREIYVNTWAAFERLDTARIDTYKRIIKKCKTSGVPLGIITDYIPDMLPLTAGSAGRS